MSTLKTWFVVGILKFQKWFDVFWAFKLSFVVDILDFLTRKLFGLLFKNLGNFFSNLLVNLNDMLLQN